MARYDWRWALIRRGEIYWVQLDPTIGSEIKKTRPALVVSNDQNNQASSLITIAPITSNAKIFGPFEVELKIGEGGLKKPGKIKLNQIRTIDKRRLVDGPLGPVLEGAIMKQVGIAIKIHLSID